MFTVDEIAVTVVNAFPWITHAQARRNVTMWAGQFGYDVPPPGGVLPALAVSGEHCGRIVGAIAIDDYERWEISQGVQLEIIAEKVDEAADVDKPHLRIELADAVRQAVVGGLSVLAVAHHLQIPGEEVMQMIRSTDGA
jgi:hypothetical protein